VDLQLLSIENYHLKKLSIASITSAALLLAGLELFATRFSKTLPGVNEPQQEEQYPVPGIRILT
jgi:hypothetical protein